MFFFFECFDINLLYRIKVTGDLAWQAYFHNETVDTHVKYFGETPYFVTTESQTLLVKERTNFFLTGYHADNHYWNESCVPFNSFILEEFDGEIIDSVIGDWSSDYAVQSTIGQYHIRPRGCYLSIGK